MKRAEVRKLASSCVLRCKARGLRTFEDRLQTALDLEDFAFAMADRSAEHLEAAIKNLQRLNELARLATDTLYELSQTTIQADSGDVEVRICGSFTPAALDAVLARLRAEQRQAMEYRGMANRVIEGAAVSILPMEALS